VLVLLLVPLFGFVALALFFIIVGVCMGETDEMARFFALALGVPTLIICVAAITALFSREAARDVAVNAGVAEYYLDDNNTKAFRYTPAPPLTAPPLTAPPLTAEEINSATLEFELDKAP